VWKPGKESFKKRIKTLFKS